MPSTVPAPFLFRFSFPVPKRDDLPRRSPLLSLPDECRIPFPSTLTGSAPFADVRAAWNEQGFGISVEVTGKSEPPQGRADRPEEADGLQLWIDTRNTQNIHRASRFCQFFCLLPAAEGSGGPEAFVVPRPIPRAREEAPRPDPDNVLLHTSFSRGKYRLEAWFPTSTLNGFDPEASPKLGFYCVVRDRELGEQFLTVGRDFPYNSDPSLWSTLELVPSR